jgi:hypothetical protein
MRFSFVSDGYRRACQGIEQARETIVVTVREEYADRLAVASPAELTKLENEILEVIEARLKPPSRWAFY